MADNKVSVEITLEEKAALKALTQLTSQIQKTEKGFDNLGASGDKSLSLLEKAGQGVSSGFGSLVGGVTVANLASNAIIGVANEIKNFVTGSVNAAIEQENAINRLNQALRASGDFSSEASDDLLAFASGLQKVSVFGDEVVVGQLAVAKSFGASNEQTKQLVEAAANLSATFGGSLESNVEKLGKTFSGEAGRLAQYIPALKELTSEQLKSGAAFEIVNSKFAGAAANELNTYSGQVTSLSNAYSDLQEELGGFITGSDAVNRGSGILKGIFEELTQQLIDYRIESQRNNEGFQEDQESINQLSREYEELSGKIERARAVLAEEADPNTGFFKGLFLNTAKAKEDIRDLSILQERLFNQINEATPVEQTTEQGNNPKTITTEDPRLAKERETQIGIALIKEQARIAAEEQDALVNESLLGTRELEVAQAYEFEALKLEATLQAEEEKANLIKDSSERNLKLQEIAAKRELEFTKLGNNQIKAENQRKLKDQEAINTALLASLSNFLGAGQLLAKEGSNAQKALQVTQATIATYTAANNALAQPVPYPVAVAMAASAVALGLANVAKISGAKFEYGGIVGGNSMTGDMIPARVNSGEMILNRQQQTNLFNMANGGSGNSDLGEKIDRLTSAILAQPVNISVDGRALATVIRSEVRSGFKLG